MSDATARAIAPPRRRSGPLRWLRRNLFSSPLDTALTLAALYGLYLTLPPLVQWAFIDADWVGTSRADCTSGGACWVFIATRLEQFLYGFYPAAEQWRVNLGFGLLVAVLAALSWRGLRRRWLAAALLLGYPVVAYLLFYGGALGLAVVPTHQWGGLMLTLVLAIVGIVLALPLGVLLALGRRSELPLIRAACITYIEVWRGVPLITVLFMASVMLPLFFPEEVTLDKLLRAMIGIVMFQAAYMAEVVRGGLQAIPKGQYEAAEALGLGYWQRMGLIVLPQALRLVIPGIVNTFIALFKDTTLVLIIGLFDLLGIVQQAFADPDWLGYSVEGYVFAGLLYWVFCFGMSRWSQRLERRLGQGR
ncbi:amino acid ABC transporter permease [Thiococcus pfennigii]|jgi:general L-amino acid transport system permease protein|uniref:amino acid ABC transporter permease n=1 Tax=Thiococcus pfennigii TaxID=1057 RepID=UPI0019036CB9|nr:amino acid ABC transporter permease [Thiococcus pfennigii]MBK1732197.1 amino acid ABC transporter permease [Thiococcus pfennigii]